MTSDEKKEIYKRFENLERQNHRILMILESDDKIKEKGLVETVTEIRSDLNELLVREQVYKAKSTTWGVIGGAIVTGLFWLAKLLIGKFIV